MRRIVLVYEQLISPDIVNEYMGIYMFGAKLCTATQNVKHKV